MFRILFVCSGNICRSPTAEGVFLNLVRSRNLDNRISADSAGTGAWHQGQAPDARSQQTALTRGIDISDQRARAVRADDFAAFDLIMAMDSSHLHSLRASCPTAHIDRLRLFMDYAPETGIADVPDPYYGAGDGFARVFDMIEAASSGLLRDIEENHLR
ncbi:MAG: protein-tyrosine phosphatase [Paracoccaceae bacterium]